MSLPAPWEPPAACQALRSKYRRAACGRDAAHGYFLLVHHGGFCLIALCVWCAVETPRQWNAPTGLPGPHDSVGLYLAPADMEHQEDLTVPRHLRGGTSAPVPGEGSGRKGRPVPAAPRPVEPVLKDTALSALEGIL